MEEEKVPEHVKEHIKLAMKITDMLKECKTPKDSLSILANVTFNFFIISTKSGRTLAAFREYCESLRSKIIAAEEMGIKSMVDGLQETTDAQIKTVFEKLKKEIKSLPKEEDFDFRDN